MMTDPIADMLSRIRNASSVKKKTVTLPFSRIKKALADILQREGYLETVAVTEQGAFKELELTLKYDAERRPVIHSIKRVSKPGCRRYVTTKNLPVVLNNYGLVIVSTSRGVLTNHEARKLKVGGEVLCEVS